MRRYTDSLLFVFLLLIDVVAAFVVWASGSLPSEGPEVFASMTVGVFAVVAAPAFAAAAVLSLGRTLRGVSPRQFWTWMTGGTLLLTLIALVMTFVTEAMGIQLGFSTVVWLMLILTVSSLVALFLALIGAIPAVEVPQEVELDSVSVEESGTVDVPTSDQVPEETV